ncbi:MAG: DUF4143 domain-containing protein [Chitinophagaceae bacterium]
MSYLLGIQKDIITTKGPDTVYIGIMIVHLLGQELLGSQYNTLSELHFWVREKKQSQAEVDFIYPYNGKLIPVEVKSGAPGT